MWYCTPAEVGCVGPNDVNTASYCKRGTTYLVVRSVRTITDDDDCAVYLVEDKGHVECRIYTLKDKGEVESTVCTLEDKEHVESTLCAVENIEICKCTLCTMGDKEEGACTRCTLASLELLPPGRSLTLVPLAATT